nr:DUF1345 domain-containing protein [Pseudomonadota bacterium]
MAASKSRTARKGWFARRWHRIRRRPRFNSCALLFVVLTVSMIAVGVRPQRGLLLAFDIAAVIFLGSTGYMFAHSKTSSMRARARQQDEGYWGFLLSSAAVSSVALIALALELHASKSGGALEIVLAACSLLLAWLFMNTIFAL